MAARVLLGAVALVSLASAPGAAQILIAPPSLFMSDDNRFATFYVTNQSAEPQEVTIETQFGYPAADTSGAVAMVWEDSVTEARRSIASWVRAFPRRFVLPAGQRQVVRFTINPPPGLDAGVYWTRLITTSTPQAAVVDTASEGVSTEIVFRLRQIGTIFYSQGDVATGLELDPIAVDVESTGVMIETIARPQGNAPYLGTLSLRVRNGAGGEVFSDSTGTALYADQKYRWLLPLELFRPGAVYTVEITAAAERGDIAPDDIFPAAPSAVRSSFTME